MLRGKEPQAAWLISSRSKGSRWWLGSSATCSAWLCATGNVEVPLERIRLGT
jgi:hypothetical protein